MTEFEQPARARLDLAALRRNVRRVQQHAEGTPLMAVVKADAYGHGVEHVVPVLRAEGVCAFAVASLAEGARLREMGVTEPVLVFAGPLPEALPAYARLGLEVTVSSPALVEAVLASPERLRVHLKVDTGMHRLGVAPEEAPEVLRRLASAPHVEVAGVWTHFATADAADPSFAREQLAHFEAVARAAPEVPVHLANSGAIAHLPEAVRGRAFIRPGGLLYGLPTTRAVARALPTEPVLQFASRIVRVETVAAGETVSYDRTWRASRPTRIATLAAGYADGVPRSLSNRGVARVHGRDYPIAGRVCMDALMLDLGEADVSVGDEAVLWGWNGPSVLAVAEAADTITYALTCGLSARVPREPVGR